MPLPRLLPRLNRVLQTEGIIRQLDQLKRFAEDKGAAPAAFAYDDPGQVVAKLNSIPFDKGIGGMDRKLNDIAPRMRIILKEAWQQGYNIDNVEVFKMIYWIASELTAQGYEPMRVQGATADEMVKPAKKGK
jgi:hypothetical protein